MSKREVSGTGVEPTAAGGDRSFGGAPVGLLPVPGVIVDLYCEICFAPGVATPHGWRCRKHEGVR